MIKVEGLTKRYARTVAVDNISFEIEKGQIVGFLGPNGAGKTTTMRVLTCFLPPSAGTASVAGYDVLENPMEVKKRIGYLPETPPLYPEMDVSGYLDFAGRLKGISSADIGKRADEVMEKCALGDVRHKLIGKLSKGYRQRVGLAQAIIHNPDVLILDEPTSGLDPKQIIEIRELLKHLAGEHTIILSTHILSEVEHSCERVIIIARASWWPPIRYPISPTGCAVPNPSPSKSKRPTAIPLPPKCSSAWNRFPASAGWSAEIPKMDASDLKSRACTAARFVPTWPAAWLTPAGT